MPVRHLLLLLVLLASCSSHKEWTYSNVLSKSPEFNSSQLLYQPENETIGVGVEFLQGVFGTLGYLYVKNRKIPALPGDPLRCMVVFIIEEEQFPYQADRMEGGQRLLLPQEATQQLTHSLKNGQTVTIYLDGFKSTLDPSTFAKQSKKFL